MIAMKLTKPQYRCSLCGQKMAIRSSRPAGNNHTEYHLICRPCDHQADELFRHIGPEHIFMDKCGLDSIQRFISMRDIDDNLWHIRKAYEAKEIELRDKELALQNQILLIEEARKLAQEKMAMVDRIRAGKI